MSLMQMIFKKPEEVFGEDGEEPVEKQPLDLLSVKGDRISTVLETENIELLLEKDSDGMPLCGKCGCPKRIDGYDDRRKEGY